MKVHYISLKALRTRSEYGSNLYIAVSVHKQLGHVVTLWDLSCLKKKHETPCKTGYFVQLWGKQGSVSSSLEAHVCSGFVVAMAAATSVSSDSLTPLDPLVILSSVCGKERDLTWTQQGNSTVPRLENQNNTTGPLENAKTAGAAFFSDYTWGIARCHGWMSLIQVLLHVGFLNSDWTYCPSATSNKKNLQTRSPPAITGRLCLHSSSRAS